MTRINSKNVITNVKSGAGMKNQLATPVIIAAIAIAVYVTVKNSTIKIINFTFIVHLTVGHELA